MKLTMIGSHLCQDTLYVLIKLKEKGAEIKFQDISSSFSALKKYVEIREQNPKYEQVKKNGGIGIPFMIFEDGTETLSLEDALTKLVQAADEKV